MRITILIEGGSPTSVEVHASTTLELLRSVIQAECGVPASRQRLECNGRKIEGSGQETLHALSVKEDDLIVVKHVASAAASSTGTNATTASLSTKRGEGATEDYRGLRLEDIPQNCDPERMRAIVLANPSELRRLKFTNPKLAAAIEDPDPKKLELYFFEQQMDRTAKMVEARNAERDLRARLMRNPMDVEAQRQLERIIQQRNIAQNMELALEHSPESFSRVTMLYVDCEVNGEPVKAFVDSGAQSTIMSESCARKCNLMRLVDTRFAGTAVGVGSAKILGRVHMAQLKMGGLHFNCTFTVMEDQHHTSKHEFLFGLDMLRRHRCCIDLKSNCLCVEGFSGKVERVPFLSEAELSKVRLGNAASVANETSSSGSNKRPRGNETTRDNGGAVAAATSNGNTTNSSTPASSAGPITLDDLDFAMSNMGGEGST
eukprot:g2425.t1